MRRLRESDEAPVSAVADGHGSKGDQPGFLCPSAQFQLREHSLGRGGVDDEVRAFRPVFSIQWPVEDISYADLNLEIRANAANAIGESVSLRSTDVLVLEDLTNEEARRHDPLVPQNEFLHTNPRQELGSRTAKGTTSP